MGGENSLFLLPPGFAIVPYAAIVFFAIFECSFHHVVPATSLVITARSWNGIGNLVSKCLVAFLWHQAVHSCQVPSNFEVVANDTTGLVNSPLQIMRPVIKELFVHEGAVAVIGEMITDGIERVFEKLCVVFFASCKIQVDQICRSMVTYGVPILLRFVYTE